MTTFVAQNPNVMHQLLRYSLVLILFISAGSAYSQTLVATPNVIPKGNITNITITGTGTDFTSGGLTVTLIATVGATDTIYGTSVIAIDSVTLSADFYAPCTIAEGFYTIYLFDNTDGTLIESSAIYIEDNLGVWLDISNVKCHDDANGHINAVLTPQMQQHISPYRTGSGYYDFAWSTGSTDYYITDLTAGTYWVILTDQMTGCTDSLGATLINPPLMEVFWTKVDANCGMADGIAWVDSIVGGLGTMNIMWGPGEVSNDTIYGLYQSNNEYSLWVSDSFSCEHYFPFYIYEQLTLDFTTVNTNCANPQGSATVTVLNGTAPYTYIWSNADDNTTADSLSAGQYSIEVSDATGCTGYDIVHIIGTDGPQIASIVTGSPSCGGLTNGSINISVTGGTAPYAYAWSNGASTQDLTNVPAGIYEVMVTDATGCSVSQCVNLAQDAQLTIEYASGISSSCGLPDGALEAYAVGGTGPITLQWDAAAGSQTGNYIFGVTAGIYMVTATDSLGCTDSTWVTVSDWDGPWWAYDSSFVANCGLSDGSFHITPQYGNGGPYSVSWSNGTTNEDLLNVESGLYYFMVTDVAGCKVAGNAWVEGFTPSGQDICIVTVDSLTGSNLVAWEKAPLTDIDHYNIYREACGNVNGFAWVGAVPYDSLSQFIDYGANANVKSWRYRMTAVDDCGTESEVSPVHKTIHLSVTRLSNNNPKVQWDTYLGFNYTEQILWRYHDSNGWTILDTIAASDRQYVDTSTLALDSVEYFIEIFAPSGCISTRAVNHNSTRSNRGTIAAPNSDAVSALETINFLHVYPNPSEGIFNLQYSAQQSETTTIRVFDLNGKLVKIITVNSVAGNNNYLLNLSALAGGIYQVTLTTGTSITGTRVMKN
jgi:trimeric autotransporter adhesin